ncbi:MAG: hypothetical protein EPO24_11090 [Bacteroidetes bacterium]|nr:MAG: hypothetical protein EPO24_11090 [Bacteroidota bacterium]
MAGLSQKIVGATFMVALPTQNRRHKVCDYTKTAFETTPLTLNDENNLIPLELSEMLNELLYEP